VPANGPCDLVDHAGTLFFVDFDHTLHHREVVAVVFGNLDQRT
jgi:hypothetical protein